MKKNNKIILSAIVIITLLFSYSCDPFDDIYLTMSMDLDFSKSESTPVIFIPAKICLDSLEDYRDNKENIEEILYVSTAYLTLNATTGLRGDNLKLTVYKEDLSTVLFQYSQSSFTANDYKDHPLEIILSEQEKAAINDYLKNPEINKCFNATFELSNITHSSPQQVYTLESKVEFLTRVKIKQ